MSQTLADMWREIATAMEIDDSTPKAWRTMFYAGATATLLLLDRSGDVEAAFERLRREAVEEKFSNASQPRR